MIGKVVTGLFYKKPQTLGEGMKRVVEYASKGAKEAAYTIKHTPGNRVYNNGVVLGSYKNGFTVSLENGTTGNLLDVAGKTKDISDIKKAMKAANVISRGRLVEGKTEIVTDSFSRGWKAIQRFFKKDAFADKMYAKKTISLPNSTEKLDDFCIKYL